MTVERKIYRPRKNSWDYTEKECIDCKQIKSLDDFHRSKQEKDGRIIRCRKCSALYNKGSYSKNPERFKRNVKNRNNSILFDLKVIKSKAKCCDCGICYPEEPWLMEFDHVRCKKIMCLGHLAKRGSRSMLYDEIAKCDIVCVVCHRRRTAARSGWSFLPGEGYKNIIDESKCQHNQGSLNISKKLVDSHPSSVL